MKASLLDYMGTDLTVVNAARVSFGKRSEELSDKDIKLIKYLTEHNHWTPFSHVIYQFHIRAPIFVARQMWKSHVGASGGDCGYPGWNETSYRYVGDDPELYRIEEFRSKPDGSIKQGSGEPLGWEDNIQAHELIGFLKGNLNIICDRFKYLGIAPEQIRTVYPMSTYTEWWWTGSLAFFSRVCKLRQDHHAQKETQDLANQIADAIKAANNCPHSWETLNG